MDVDLTPRTADERAATASERRRRWSPVTIAVLVLLAGGLVFLVAQLMDATMYFYNADEAVERRDELGDRRFRIQGEVQEGVTESAQGADFAIAFNGVSVRVTHAGDPPDLFRPGIPVVLEGRWDGERFVSDTMLVKHSEEYKADNPDRVPPDAP
ncbi:MAG: cytochrome c maturation protein CcmE [Acidimicrobiales bacterium]